MDSLRVSVTWFAFGAVIGIAMLLQPVIAPVLPKDPGDRLVYVFKRGLTHAGGTASAVELTEGRDGLVVENLSIAKDMDGRQIGFSVDRMALSDVHTDRFVDLYLGRSSEEIIQSPAPKHFAASLLLEGLQLRTGQDVLSVKTIGLKNVGADDYHQWFDPDTFRNGSYASVLAFLVLAGTADSASAQEVFFRNQSTVPISASIDEIEAVDVAAGQVANVKVRNAVAQWRVGNGITVQSVSIQTLNAREVVSAAAGYDNDVAAPEALIFDLVEFADFSLHTPDIEILRIPDGKVATYTQLGRIPVSARLELLDLSLEVDALESDTVREYLRDSGIGAIAADVSLAYIFDRNSGLLTIKDGAIKAPDLATLDLNAELSGINPSWDAIADFVSGLQHSQVVGAQARFEDHSIVSKLSEKWVRDTQRRPQDLVTWMISVDTDQAAASSKVTMAAEALRDFVGSPEALTINVAPETPVSLNTLFGGVSPEEVFEKMAVDVVLEATSTGQFVPD